MPRTSADRELKRGEQLVLDLADDWHPERFRDEFAEKVQALIEAKRKAGEIKQVAEIMGDEVVPATADVIDLTELLRRSLKAGSDTAPPPPAKKTAARAPRVKSAANDEQRAVAAAKPTAKAKTSVKAAKRKSA